MDATFTTSLDPLASARLIIAVLEQSGYRVVYHRSGNGISVIGHSARHALVQLWKPQPQRCAWFLSARHATTQVQFATMYSRSYATALLVTSATLIVVLVSTIMSLLESTHALYGGHNDPSQVTGRLFTFAISFVCIYYVARAIRSDGADFRRQLMRAVHVAHKESGFTFLCDHRGVRHRHGTYANAFQLIVVIALVASALVASTLFPLAISRFQSWLLVVPLFLLVPLFIVGRGPGFSDRTAICWPTTNVAIGSMFLLTCVLVFAFLGRRGEEYWLSVREHGAAPVLVATIGFIAALSAVFITRGLKDSLQVVRIEEDVSSRSGIVRADDAITVSMLHPGWRYMQLFIWIFAALPLVSMSGFATYSVLRWLGNTEEPGAVSALSWVLSDVTSTDARNSTLAIAVFVLWLPFVLPICCAIPLSLGQYFLQLWRVRRCLRYQRLEHDPEYRRVHTLVAALARIGRIPPPRVLLLQSPEHFAAADVFGIGHRSRVIIISRGCVDMLNCAELRALLAHEMAHHINGDCVRHRVLCLLARATLLGDAFIVVLENSVQCEARADRTAVTDFEVSTNALASSIRKMNAAFAAQTTLRRIGMPYIGTRASSRTHRTEGSREGTLGFLRLWWHLYTCDTSMGYWHPTTRDRLERLERYNRTNRPAK